MRRKETSPGDIQIYTAILLNQFYLIYFKLTEYNIAHVTSYREHRVEERLRIGELGEMS